MWATQRPQHIQRDRAWQVGGKERTVEGGEPEENTGPGVGEERGVLQLGQELGFYSRCDRKSPVVFRLLILIVFSSRTVTRSDLHGGLATVVAVCRTGNRRAGTRAGGLLRATSVVW